MVELKPGESLFQEEGGSLYEEDRGFFFIEDGLMTIERDPALMSRNTTSMRTSFLPNNGGPHMPRSDSTASIGHLHARAPTLGREDARLKQLRRGERGLQNFRLARIGQGWVVGTIEGCSGMKNSGKHIAGKPFGQQASLLLAYDLDMPDAYVSRLLPLWYSYGMPVALVAVCSRQGD